MTQTTTAPQYHTTASSCSCPEFQYSDRFTICEHMKAHYRPAAPPPTYAPATAHPEHGTTLDTCRCGDFQYRTWPSHSTSDQRRCKHIAKIQREVQYFQTTLDDGFGRPYCGCFEYIQEQADSCIYLELLGQVAAQQAKSRA